MHKPKYPSSTPWKIEWQRLIVYVKLDCYNPIPHLRTIAVRKDSGRLLAPLQKCYDYICEILKTKQLGLEHLFWLQDPDLFLVFTRPVVANYPNIELGQLVFGTGHIFWIHVPMFESAKASWWKDEVQQLAKDIQGRVDVSWWHMPRWHRCFSLQTRQVLYSYTFHVNLSNSKRFFLFHVVMI